MEEPDEDLKNSIVNQALRGFHFALKDQEGLTERQNYYYHCSARLPTPQVSVKGTHGAQSQLRAAPEYGPDTRQASFVKGLMSSLKVGVDCPDGRYVQLPFAEVNAA